MRMWLLLPISLDRPGPWRPVWDKAYGFVVRAETEAQARQVVADSDETGDEGADVWLDPTLALCREIPLDGTPEVIMRDFHNG